MTRLASGTADPLSLHGVIPPTATVYESDGTLDPTATAAHAQFVADRGAHAVFPLGTNGEFALLSAEERRRVVEHVASAVDVPVIAGVGEPGTRETIARTKAAAEAGADGLVVVTPSYYPVDADGMVTHYRRVTEAVDLPVYVYHIPSKTGNSVALDTLDRIAALDGIAGCKDSSKDVPWLGQATDRNPELTFLAGSDSLVFAGMSVGCSGVVSAVANAFPELVVETYEAFAAGDRETARRLQSRIFAVRDALKRGPYMAGVKAALSLRDTPFDPGGLRDPLREMADDERAELAATLRELELL